MPSSAVRITTTAGRPATGLPVRLLSLLLVLLGLAAFLVRGYHDERLALHFRDFKQPYAGARCLIDGCDPYSEAATEQAFIRAGGVNNDAVAFEPYSALYPPFSFVVLTPIAALTYPVARKVWEAIIAGLFSAAVLLAAELCAPFFSLSIAPVLALFAASGTILLMLGQITGVVLSLLVIGLWCLVRQRLIWLAVFCLTVAALLKPHDAALVILYLPFAGRSWRRVFVWVVCASLLIAVGSILWVSHQPASAHWLPELEANLHGNSSAGAVNDPHHGYLQAVNMANLQALFAPVLPSAAAYNAAAVGLTCLLVGFWAWPALRMPQSTLKHLLALAAMACITLLPLYHRQYDTRIYLLLFPATALLLTWKRRAWGWSALILLLLGVILTAHQFLNFLIRTQHPQIASAGALRTAFEYRPIPAIDLVLACFFLAAFWKAYRAERPRGFLSRQAAP